MMFLSTALVKVIPLKRPPRSLEEQLEAPAALRIREIQDRLQNIRPSVHSASYFVSEISRSINAGLLLSAVVLSATLLEVWLRALLVNQISVTTGRVDFAKIDRELEGPDSNGKGRMFPRIVDELVLRGVLLEHEKGWLIGFYKAVRIPLAHGISGRLLGQVGPAMGGTDVLEWEIHRGDPKTAEFFDEFLNDPWRRGRSLEDFIDAQAADILNGVVEFLAKYPLEERSSRPRP